MQVIIPSRVDPLPLLDCDSKQFFIKRDDLLPNGGTKTRKYASLLPFLLKEGHEEVQLKGGKQSNHLHYFSKLLAQEGIEVCEEGFVIEEGGSQKESIVGAMSLANDILLIDILPSLKKGDSYCFSLGCRLIASVGSCPQFALESFTVFSDPCFFGLTL